MTRVFLCSFCGSDLRCVGRFYISLSALIAAPTAPPTHARNLSQYISSCSLPPIAPSSSSSSSRGPAAYSSSRPSATQAVPGFPPNTAARLETVHAAQPSASRCLACWPCVRHAPPRATAPPSPVTPQNCQRFKKAALRFLWSFFASHQRRHTAVPVHFRPKYQPSLICFY
jgi:hypothetical protein